MEHGGEGASRHYAKRGEEVTRKSLLLGNFEEGGSTFWGLTWNEGFAGPGPGFRCTGINTTRRADLGRRSWARLIPAEATK